jgi:hypothetical protein
MSPKEGKRKIRKHLMSGLNFVNKSSYNAKKGSENQVSVNKSMSKGYSGLYYSKKFGR